MLIQKEWELLNALIDLIYKSKNLTTMRYDFLKTLALLIGYDFADFELGHAAGTSTMPNLSDPVVFSRYDRAFEQEFIGLYERTYHELDYVKWVFSSPTSLVYRESDLINDQARKRSKFYLDYLVPFGFEHLAGISIISDGKFSGSVTLYRAQGRDDFSEKDMYVLKQLLPHLQNRLDFSEQQEEGMNASSYLLKNRYLLTPREIQAACLICEGKSNAEIGKALGIAENTVKKHVSNIFDKLEVKNRTSLTHFMIKNGIF